MDIEVKFLSKEGLDDFIQLINVFRQAFESGNLEVVNHDHLLLLLNKPDFFALVAKHNSKVVGGLTVYVLHQYYSTKPVAYIYDVGILPDYQRKSIGKKLIAHLNNFCREKGFKDAYVAAKTDDTQAVNFYRSTSVNGELQATHFTYTFENIDTEE